MGSGKKSDGEPNLKIPLQSLNQLKKMNSRLVNLGWDNVKVMMAVIVDEFYTSTNNMTKQELFAYVVSKEYDLRKRGIIDKHSRLTGRLK